MGFSTEKNNFAKMLGAAANDYAVATHIFNDLNDNGFELIYKDSANLFNSKTVIFQTTNAVDPLATVGTTHASNPEADATKYRVGFIVDGFEDNQLTMYIGTAETMNESEGINTTHSHKVVLLQGGETVLDSRMDESNQYSYRLTITDRGFAVIVWDQLRIENMKYSGICCCQRPVSCDGTTFTGGSQPVFAIHNTNPQYNGRAQIYDRFYYSVIREKDTDVPTKGDERLNAGFHSTVFINVNKTTAGHSGTLNINGADLSSAAQNTVNGSYKLAYNTSQENLMNSVYDEIRKAQDIYKDGRLSKFTITKQATENRLMLVAKEPGETPDLTITAGGQLSLDPETGWAGAGTGEKASGFLMFTDVPYWKDPDPEDLNALRDERAPSAPAYQEAGRGYTGDVIVINGVPYTFVITNPGDNEIQVVPGDLDATLTNVEYTLNSSTDNRLNVAMYAKDYVSATEQGYITVHFLRSGITGNDFSIEVIRTGGDAPADNSATDIIQRSDATLSGGAGFDPTDADTIWSHEISDQSGINGNTLHQFPNQWTNPVTTDDGEYVLTFPFGLATTRMAYTEEMDMIAVSKGPAYQGGQAVTINVYGEGREYTAYSSNYASRPDEFVRIFIMSSGGGI